MSESCDWRKRGKEGVKDNGNEREGKRKENENEEGEGGREAGRE